ncbi:hypothetical protein [Streptomyces xiamenensis]|uniref:hypothetical protein n=1 Tax=Streptomyces xiamenensis TaxID=408015 RepID=UPI0035DC06EC
MEILLLACMLAYGAGSQSEQSKLGLSPAQRAQLREQTRHEKAVRKIAAKHGVDASEAGVSPWKNRADINETTVVPGTFRSGFRTVLPAAGPGVGHRAGEWTAKGLSWARDTGRGALETYRRRRQAAGHEDPAPVLVPMPPSQPPHVPPMPTMPPSVADSDTNGTSGDGVSLSKPGDTPGQEGAAQAPEGAVNGPSGGGAAADAQQGPNAPQNPAGGPAADGDAGQSAGGGGQGAGADPAPANTPPEPANEAVTEPGTAPVTATVTEPATTDTAVTEPATEEEPAATQNGPAATDTGTETPTVAPAATQEATATTEPATAEAAGVTPDETRDEPAIAGDGVGRMAAEVTYESVMEESEELSLMCDDDIAVYDRVRRRCEREIGRADSLVASLHQAGAGQRVTGWVVRCREQYQVILSQLDQLERNTTSQGEAVVKARALLEAGQGVYAGIAADMESVAERGFYISDAVDGEDANAHTEIYEKAGA